jgi:hypothetical protein
VDRSTAVARFANICKYHTEVIFRFYLLDLLLLAGVVALLDLLRFGCTVRGNSVMRMQVQDRGFRLQNMPTIAQDSMIVVPVTLLNWVLATR